MKLGLVSLGCSKNRVDSEILLGHLAALGFSLTPKAEDAEVIVVNTCGFIIPAKEESIKTILEMAGHKAANGGECRLLAVTGCLSQRYMEELKAEMPEVDIFWGVKDQRGLAAAIAEHAGLSSAYRCEARRLLTTPAYSAYLRIADGCDNRCAYCAIPLIRGSRVSMSMEMLVAEAEALSQQGVKELVVIAQDTSAYGMDLYGKPMLGTLLRKLCRVDGLRWIRVLYTYPNTVNEALIDVMLEEEKICNYIDIPIQHIDEDMLKRMNRHGSRTHIEAILRYIRQSSEDFIIRSTVILGFPGESEAAYAELLAYLKREPFDRLGAFTYSQEDNTPAAAFPNQIPEDCKAKRLAAVMAQQQEISLAFNNKRIGQCYPVLVERLEAEHAYGRSYAEAPEVDGQIRFLRKPGHALLPGDFTMVRITGAEYYDLWGEEM